MRRFANISSDDSCAVPVLSPEPEQPRERAYAAAVLPTDSLGHFDELFRAGLQIGAVLDSISEPVLIVNEVGRIILSNKSATTLFGCYDPTCPPVPAAIPDILPWGVLYDALGSAQNGLRPMQQDVFDPASNRHWRATIGRLSPSSRGTHFVLRLRDETEVCRLRRSLRTSEALARTGSILAGSAHQAKNVLFGITASIEALRLRHRELLEGDPLMQNLSDAIGRMQNMLRDLFDLGGSSGEERNLLSAEALVRGAIDACGQIARQRRVSIESEFVHGISMYGAALPLSRALENVIDNAVRHSPENGTVWVQQRLAPEHSGWLQCTILDSGPGFPSSEMERLFDPFFTTRPGGTGLGLAVARRVVEDHGGKLELSNGSTGGACVTFLLPRDRRTLNLDDITKSAELN